MRVEISASGSVPDCGMSPKIPKVISGSWSHSWIESVPDLLNGLMYQ